MIEGWLVVVWLLLDTFFWMGSTSLVARKIRRIGGAAFLYMYSGPPCMMHHETARCMQCTTTNWSDMDRKIFVYSMWTLLGAPYTL